jgi:hypothetical protein
MPAFQNSPFLQPRLLQKGVPAYLIGSFSQQVGNTKLAVTLNSIAANVGIIDGQLIDGPLPVVGSLISVINTTNSAGAFNVNRAVITGVAYTVATNVMQIQFALTGTNQSLTADAGTAIIEPAEVGETVATTYTSIAVLVQAPEGDSQFTLPLSVLAGAGVTAMTATLQVAIKAQSNEWTNTAFVVTKTGATTYTAGPVVQATLQRGYLYRLAVTAVTGSDVVVAKVG